MLDYSKIIVLILSTKDSEYDDFRTAIESTWLQDFKNLGIKCFFYEGGSDKNKIEGDYIKLKCPDDLYSVSLKLIEALKVVFEKYPEIQLVYRTNLSSYIDVKTLNVMTGSTGIYEGASEEMMAVGDYVTDTLSNLDSTSADEDWQAAFTALASAIDDAVDYISTQRGIFGSQINRLSFMTTNLQANSTNLQNSRSSIIDTDFAAETAALTKGQIMQQAATAMLAQANQKTTVILSLLK